MELNVNESIQNFSIEKMSKDFDRQIDDSRNNRQQQKQLQRKSKLLDFDKNNNSNDHDDDYQVASLKNTLNYDISKKFVDNHIDNEDGDLDDDDEKLLWSIKSISFEEWLDFEHSYCNKSTLKNIEVDKIFQIMSIF